MMRALLVLLAFAAPAYAADRLVTIETRPGVTVGYWLMERPGATATVLLIPGGAGGLGMKNGAPASDNFLVRSRELFAEAGYNVAIIGKPSDREDLDEYFRTTAEHVADLRAVIEKVRSEEGKPVWLIGTSRGTISAAAAAAALDPADLAGIVLTSSITNGRGASVTTIDLARIRVALLVVHHRYDACPSCNPREAPRIVEAAVNAPAKRFLLLSGGSFPSGPVCEPRHYHGFNGMEREAIGELTAWMREQESRRQSTLPGFMRPAGSSVFLMARMRSSSSGLL